MRKQLGMKVWIDVMPGGDRLARELGVGANTMEAALKILEYEGWLVNQGRRRGRIIQLREKSPIETGMRLGILLGDSSDRQKDHMQSLTNDLEKEGYVVHFAKKSQDELGNNVEKISCLVRETPADAWIVCSGARETLEWFEGYEIPSFALFGRANRVRIPSFAPDKIKPLRDILRKLADLGHRHIVNICRPIRRIPEPGLFEREFLAELESLGIPTSRYHLPSWDENIESFHRCLDSLFRVTPPTALIVDEGVFVPPILQYCIKAGLRIPEDFSLVCTDPDPAFAWCKPSIAHIKWDSRPIARRVVKWATNVASGREDHQKSFFKASFIGGDTIGPAPAEI